jgi:hypothetical protein
MDANSIAIGRERVSDRSEIIDPHRHPVRYITQQLGETAKQARGMIWHIVHECGAEQALEWLREAQEIESHGGMMTEDGERRRTPGGVFFKLVRDKLGGSGALGDARAMERYRAIFGTPRWRERARPGFGDAAPPPPPPPPPAPIPWEERAAHWRALEARSGGATALKLELTGKPGNVIEKERQTMLMLTHHGALPPMPRAVPVPPEPIDLAYIVTINAKHWRPAQERPPASLLTFSGVGLYDPELEGMSVFAMGPVKVRNPDDRLAEGDLKPPDITVVGQVGTPLIRPDITLVRMIYAGPLPALPKGLERPDPVSVRPIGLYITAKAWRKVAAALADDPADTFIGSGTPYYDAALGMVAVNITTATTRAVERAQRQSSAAAP